MVAMYVVADSDSFSSSVCSGFAGIAEPKSDICNDVVVVEDFLQLAQTDDPDVMPYEDPCLCGRPERENAFAEAITHDAIR
eukprot:CAMPEP_0178483810 /NCGR_PEP_ID=MMETSP0696-20121128/7427_1 /TAXON_ID=265572 /ORGANISM="Extubocellulus spinifer, Strain CCMP396" /LENGTH=80 /DNA_ID=CAMNT_0020111341 /DNA_START=491 /DNA_END=730 /DNA_ORIENTATION=+